MSRAELIADHANKVVPELLGKTSTTILLLSWPFLSFSVSLIETARNHQPG